MCTSGKLVPTRGGTTEPSRMHRERAALYRRARCMYCRRSPAKRPTSRVPGMVHGPLWLS
ncbi:hypothetical protein BV20DRAFT_475095 [Pilatotrama ljubarskyi]|nr:hypothetical protein BV20DRAFT_475095 [Pilatotrama ljubarskyi]